MKHMVRPADMEDISALVDLLHQLFSLEEDFDFDESVQARGLTMFLDGCGKHRRIFVAEVNGKIAGMCSAQVMISTAEGGAAAVLEDLVVDSRHRGQGLGKSLLLAVNNWAEKNGIYRIQLLADKNNFRGLDFYRSQKWETTSLICLRKRI